MVDSQVIAAIIGPLVTTLLAGFAVVTRSALEARRTAGQRAESVERRHAQIASIDTWLSAHSRIADRDPEAASRAQRAIGDLEVLYQHLHHELHAAPVLRQRNGVRVAVKAFLLIGVKGAGAKALRVFYYLALLMGIFWMIAAVATAGSPTIGPGMAVLVSCILSIGGFVPAALFALFTKLADRSRRVILASPADQPGPGADPEAVWTGVWAQPQAPAPQYPNR